jgi:hypothetical protein
MVQGPDDFDNAGAPDFAQKWMEHGDIYSPVHRVSDLDQAINATAGSSPLAGMHRVGEGLVTVHEWLNLGIGVFFVCVCYFVCGLL